ncbi:DUF4153 domain-containing protein [Runella limosa]|uniref:DUF4153 domain-containing protein n=1 Tax=Runella limosa TaxID=370978 RepID=UPI0004273DB1|nr:DUF4153 domain-containing protein [Runella limosa]
MKKTIVNWGIAVSLFTYLFYEQIQGYNTIVFSATLIGLVAHTHPALLAQKQWQKSALVQLILAFAVAWHGLGWASFMYICSLLVFIGFTMAPQSTVIGAWLNGFLSAMVVSFLDNFSKIKSGIASLFQPLWRYQRQRKPSLYLMPFSVTVVFYGLYCWANPDFWLDLAWMDVKIDVWLVGFVLLGGVVLCPLFFAGSGKLPFTETPYHENLTRTKKRTAKTKVGTIALKYEYRQAVILFFMLNTLITIFLLFSMAQLLLPSLQTTKGFSEQVHEGFNALLISIASAIALIVYFFRGNQNFYANNRRLLQLAFVWIALNAALGVFTFYKNTLYVMAFGLTFKRIWVYIALLLTLGGLVLTYYKIKKVKSTAFLVRQTMWLVYATVSCYLLVDWSRLITWYNFTYAERLDMSYIQQLDVTRLPFLQAKIEQNDPRLVMYKLAIEKEIKTQKRWNSKVLDWRSRTLDGDWLRKTLK